MNAKDLLCGNPLHPDFKKEKWYGVVILYGHMYADERYKIRLGSISGVRYDEGQVPTVYLQDQWIEACCICDSPAEAVDAFVERKSNELRKSLAGGIIEMRKPPKPKKRKLFSRK